MDNAKLIDSISYAKAKCGIEFHLKEKQFTALKNVVLHKDTIGLLPTGKCYQFCSERQVF